MWVKSYSTTTKAVTAQQMWKLYADVNNWHLCDKDIEYAKMTGEFQRGSSFQLQPKGGPLVKILLIEVIENKKFTDFTKFPLATMTGEHFLQETPEGLKITVTMTVKGILGFLWRKIVAEGIIKKCPEVIEEQIKYASKF